MTKLKMLTLSSLVAATLVGSFALAHNGFFADGSPVGSMHKGMMAMHGDDYSVEMMAEHHKDGMTDMHGDDYSTEMMAEHHKDGMTDMHSNGNYGSLPDFTQLSTKLSLDDTQQSILSAMLTSHQVMHPEQASSDGTAHHDEMMADMPEHQAQMQAHQELYDQLWSSFTVEQQALWNTEMGAMAACHGAAH